MWPLFNGGMPMQYIIGPTLYIQLTLLIAKNITFIVMINLKWERRWANG